MVDKSNNFFWKLEENAKKQWIWLFALVDGQFIHAKCPLSYIHQEKKRAHTNDNVYCDQDNRSPLYSALEELPSPRAAVLDNRKGWMKLKKTLLSVVNLDTDRRVFEICGLWKMSLTRNWCEGVEREDTPMCELGRLVPLPMRSWSRPLCSDRMLKLLRSDLTWWVAPLSGY